MAQLVDHPCLPSPFFCVRYGGGIIHSNHLYNGSVLHHHHNTPPPPPPPPPHSALSQLVPPPSSPPCSSLAETSPYDLWPVSADSPPLYTPPYLDNIALPASSHPIRKRAAVPELEDLGASPMLPKRLCGITALNPNGACISSTSLLDEISANSHDNTVNDGDFGPSMDDASALCSDLEDVLDILLEEVGTAGHGSSMWDWKSEINPLDRASKPPDCDYPGLQKGVSEALQQLLSGQEINKRAPYPFEELKQEVSSAHHHQQQWSTSSRWAGPTLLDIESALAMAASPSTPTSHSSSVSSPFGEPLKNHSSLQDLLREETAPSHSCCNKEEPSDDSTRRRLQKRSHLEPRYTVKVRSEEGAGNDGYRWRKYGQKSIKNSLYPRSYYRCTSGKCSVKKQVERCHDEDASLLLVTYEGIHLHHRPNSLVGRGLLHTPHLPMPPFDKKAPHTFSPPSPPTPHPCVSSPSTNPHHVTPPSSPLLPLYPPPLSQHPHPPSTPPPLTTPSLASLPASTPPLRIT